MRESGWRNGNVQLGLRMKEIIGLNWALGNRINRVSTKQPQSNNQETL